jgi:hypothetical protein
MKNRPTDTLFLPAAYHALKCERSDHLAPTGYIQVHAYTSNARLPLEDVAVTVTAEDGTAIAMRLTDRSGKIPLIEVPVPDLAAGQSPDTGEIPYTPVNLYARKKGFEQIENESLQVFPNTVTDQNLEMIPLSELPGSWNQTEIFVTPPQNL